MILQYVVLTVQRAKRCFVCFVDEFLVFPFLKFLVLVFEFFMFSFRVFAASLST